MFKEIAVDPAAVASSYLQFNHIIDRFGIPEGRLIAAFPSKWKRLVYDAANAKHKGQLELKKIEERLSRLPSATFLSRERPGAGCAEDWIRAAMSEHRRSPFEAVIASYAVEEPGFLLPADVSGAHPSFSANRQWHIRRDSESMGNCCEQLLTHSRHIKLVDPHFNANSRRFKRPLLAFVSRVRPGTTVDIYRGDDIDVGLASHGLQQAFDSWVAKGIELRLFLRPQATMHNRFVLSDGGGVSFQIGLDDDASGDRPEDIVTILQEDIWSREWSTYAGNDCVARLNI